MQRRAHDYTPLQFRIPLPVTKAVKNGRLRGRGTHFSELQKPRHRRVLGTLIDGMSFETSPAEKVDTEVTWSGSANKRTIYDCQSTARPCSISVWPRVIVAEHSDRRLNTTFVKIFSCATRTANGLQTEPLP